jgi:hypothetical protein
MNALTRIAASTWGCTLVRAREIYTKVIRSAIAYGAGVIHDPKLPRVAKGLATSQNKGLRRVLGAYKATPVPHLELESFCPPLDLYFNKRLADFEMRIQDSGMKEKIQQACTIIARKLRNRRGRPRQPSPVPDHGKWAQAWIQEKGGPKQSSMVAMIEDWKKRNRDTGIVPSQKAYKGGYL